MFTRTLKTYGAYSAFVASLFTGFGAHAEDRTQWFDQQRSVTDGSPYGSYVFLSSRGAKGAEGKPARNDDAKVLDCWLLRQLTTTDGSPRGTVRLKC